RIDDDDIGLNRTCRVEEVIQAGRGTEHMAGCARIDEEIRVCAIADGLAHGGQTESKLRSGQFELADQDAFWRWDMKPSVFATGRQGQSEIGDQKGFSGLGFAADKQDSLRRQQPRFDQAGFRLRMIGEQFGQRQDGTGRGFSGSAHKRASAAASIKTASSTVETLRLAARRNAVRASLLTLRGMPLVA